MEKKIITKNDFTYGFELEGVFEDKFIRSLIYRVGKTKLDLDLKGDGSVRINDAMVNFDIYFNEEGTDEEGRVEEVNLGVFKNFDNMIKYLKLFEEGKNYYRNNSCGLHIHIKPKGVNNDYLKYLMFDSNFIKDMQNYATMCLCEEIRGRIRSNFYCAPALSFSKMLDYYKRLVKYAFMGNHPQGTTEFRFFSSCSHKVENVESFFDYFLKRINEMSLITKKGFVLKKAEEINFYQSPYSIGYKKVINELYNLDKSKKINICV